MPSIDIPGEYTFRFYSFDCNEPAHIHVIKQGKAAKFWLDPVEVAVKGRFTPRELREIDSIIEQHLALIMEKWDEHCGR